MFDNVQSVNAGGLSMIDAAGDFDDLAFLDLLLCMQESDLALGDAMQRIRDLNRRKRALMDDIALWEKAIRDSGAKKDKDTVNVPGGLPGHPPPGSRETDAPAAADDSGSADDGDAPLVDTEEVTDPEPDQGLALDGDVREAIGDAVRLDHRQETPQAGPGRYSSLEQRLEGGDEGGATADSPDGPGRAGRAPGTGDNSDLVRAPVPCDKKDVEAAIEAARAELESLNTNSSVMMVELQRLMNKRNEAVQFVSKLLNSSHSTAMAVINNIN